MKNYVLLSAILIACLHADAKHPSRSIESIIGQAPDAEMYRNILTQQINRNAAAMKSTAASLRLKAHTYVGNGVLQDTTYYTYSNGRGSVHPVNSSYYTSYAPLDIDTKQYIFCDSVYSYKDYQGTGNLDLSVYTYKYDAKNNVTAYKTGFMAYQYGYAMTYDVNNKLQSVFITDETGTTPKSTTNVYMFYNSQGQRVMDSLHSVQTNQPLSKREYVYDANGNKVSYLSYQYLSGQWKMSFRSIYTYDAGNRLVSKTSEYDINGTLTMVAKDSFAYTGTANQYTYFANFVWDNTNNQWGNDEMQTYILNAQGQIDTYYIYSWNTSAYWDTLERDAYFYKADLLQYTHGYVYMGNGQYNAVPYDKMTYYYEEYDPASITAVNGKTLIAVYPNPVQSELHLKGDMRNARVRVVNVSGQLMYSGISAGDDLVLDMKHYPAGSYFVSVQDEQGTSLYNGSIVKP